MNHEIAEPGSTKRIDAMSAKILECLNRAASSSPHGTLIKVDDDTWIIRDTGLTI